MIKEEKFSIFEIALFCDFYGEKTFAFWWFGISKGINFRENDQKTRKLMSAKVLRQMYVLENFSISNEGSASGSPVSLLKAMPFWLAARKTKKSKIKIFLFW